MHLFGGGGRALVGLVELFEGVVIVLGRQQLAPFDAKGLGNAQCFVSHPLVEAEDAVQLVGRQKVPQVHGAPHLGQFRMVGDHPRFDFGVEAAVHATDALHQPHRVPVQVIVDDAGGVLQVEALGEHIGRDEDAGLGDTLGGQFRTAALVVVGRKGADDVAAVAFAQTVHLVQWPDAGGAQLALQIAGRVHVLGKDKHLVCLQHGVRLEQVDQRLQFVVMGRVKVPQFVQELGQLVHIQTRLHHDLGDVVFLPIQFFDLFLELFGDDVLVQFFFFFIAAHPADAQVLPDAGHQVSVLGLPACGVLGAVQADKVEQFEQQVFATGLKGFGRTLEALEQ